MRFVLFLLLLFLNKGLFHHDHSLEFYSGGRMLSRACPFADALLHSSTSQTHPLTMTSIMQKPDGTRKRHSTAASARMRAVLDS